MSENLSVNKDKYHIYFFILTMITTEQFEEVVKNYESLVVRVAKLENEVKELKASQGWAEVDEEGNVREE